MDKGKVVTCRGRSLPRLLWEWGSRAPRRASHPRQHAGTSCIPVTLMPPMLSFPFDREGN